MRLPEDTRTLDLVEEAIHHALEGLGFSGVNDVRAGKLIDLKPKEYALLEFLMRHSDRPLTKSLIIEHVWDIHFDSISNVVEVHVNSLRNKIDRGFGVALIHTVRGVGYMLTASPP